MRGRVETEGQGARTLAMPPALAILQADFSAREGDVGADRHITRALAQKTAAAEKELAAEAAEAERQRAIEAAEQDAEREESARWAKNELRVRAAQKARRQASAAQKPVASALPQAAKKPVASAPPEANEQTAAGSQRATTPPWDDGQAPLETPDGERVREPTMLPTRSLIPYSSGPPATCAPH